MLLKFGSSERHMTPTFEGCRVSSTKTKKTKDNNDNFKMDNLKGADLARQMAAETART